MYANAKDFNKFEDVLIELIPKDDGIDTDALESLISSSTEEIENYLRSQYKLPLASVPLTLNRLCISLTKYYLYTDYSDVMPEEIEAEYKQAIKKLEQIAKGIIQLSGLDNNPPLEIATAKGIKYGSRFDNLGYFK